MSIIFECKDLTKKYGAFTAVENLNLSIERGKIIGLLGPNGSGKTTVINAIAEKLGLMGYKVKVTREPTNSILGEFVRKYAEGHKGLSTACMVTADRYEHIKNEIEPMLYDGNIVITDRYILSSLILQRMDGVNADYIMDLNALIIRPDLQVTIMADVGTLQKRLSDRAELTRFEKNNRSDEELYYMEKGIEILKKNGISVLEINNCTELDKNVDTIVEHIVKEVKRK